MKKSSKINAGDPNGTRTRVFAVKGRRPRPLDDGAARVRRGPLSRWGGLRSSALLDVWERSRQSAHAASSTCISACGRAPQSSRLTRPATNSRSEEHTSELQSLMRISYAVFCLKKKK